MKWSTLLLLALLPVGLHAQQPKAPAADAGKAVVALEDFIRHSDYSQMSISPDGKYLAAAIPFEETTVVYVLDRANGKQTATIRAAGNNTIDQFWWVNDTRLVASIAEQLGGVDHPKPNGELYAINADGSGSMQLFGYRASGGKTGSHTKQGGEQRYASAQVIDLIPGNDRQILVATVDWRNSEKAPASAELLDVYTGKTRRVAVGPSAGASFVADHQGQVRIANAPNENLDSVMYVRGGEGEDWRVFNDPKASGVIIEPRMFARDNRHVYATIERAGKADALYRIDLQDGKRELLYEGDADPGQLLLTPDRKDAYGVLTFDGKTAIRVFEPDSQFGRLALSVQKAFPGQVAAFGSFANDGKFGLVHVFSDRNPGDFYLFDTEKKNAEYLASARKWIEPEQMAAMQPIRLKARDGLELHGYLTVPPGSDGKNLPLIVNPHGGPHGPRDYWGFNPEVQLLASRGYAVLQLNFRGSGGYGGDFMRAGYKQWGLRMQDDLTDATQWAVQQGYADPKRLCIYGASYGGYAALEGVVREPDLYRCAVGYVGVYDLELMYRDGDIPRGLFGKKYLEMVLGRDGTDLRARSPASNVDKIKAALMIVVGGRDERVPPSQAKALRASLDKAGKTYEWLLKDKEGHGFYRSDNKMELYTKMLAFFATNLRGGAKP
ncbi:MAG: S9 family peptidase [Dokdonella sp.]|uniref:alpha/beta hydrolase family protein n=2 Tax=Dokdonella sp. TaxID=2291710 RepID=UPI0025BB9885|nr:S9 family peptidase [Dokdonella sp.]MBX3701196.1 S9 family peptidase [Dokdonella sp.]